MDDPINFGQVMQSAVRPLSFAALIESQTPPDATLSCNRDGICFSHRDVSLLLSTVEGPDRVISQVDDIGFDGVWYATHGDDWLEAIAFGKGRTRAAIYSFIAFCKTVRGHEQLNRQGLLV